jgi:radical SAM protein with 4Fe4S-binding SPASM domain
MFRWFTNSKAVCTAGKDLIAIDCDGNIYPCHGCLYEDKKEHVLGDIDDHNIFEVLSKFREKMSQNLAIESCPNCQVSFCLRCNHAKYSYSKEDQYFSKWCDGDAQPDICRFYNINNRVKLAFEELRRRN